jgi:hypothetical protein
MFKCDWCSLLVRVLVEKGVLVEKYMLLCAKDALISIYIWHLNP